MPSQWPNLEKRGLKLFASFPSTMKIFPVVTQPWIYKEGTVCFGETVGPCNLFNLGSELPEVIMGSEWHSHQQTDK